MGKLARILDPSFRGSVPTRHMRETIFIDLSAGVIEGCELGGIRVAIGHRTWSGLVAVIWCGRHAGIVIFVLWGAVSTSSRRTAVAAAGAHLGAAAEAAGETQDDGKKDEGADHDSDNCGPSIKMLE